MKFIKFPSLDNSNSKSSISRLEFSGITHKDVKWMATEKIHGANFAMYSNGKDFKFASRSGFVEDGDKLFDGKRVADKYKEAFMSEAHRVVNALGGLLRQHSFAHGSAYEDNTYAIMFGELFGGSIQKGMPYQAQQDLAVFDFLVVTDIVNLDIVKAVFDSGEQKAFKGYCVKEDKILLAPSEKILTLRWLQQKGIPTVKVLHVGTFEECMSVSNDFTSRHYDHETVSQLNLTEEEFDLRCKAEGVVIEPVEAMFIQQSRVYIKNRSEKFEAKKRNTGVGEKAVVDKREMLSEGAKELLAYSLPLVNEDRFESVVSHIGEVSIKDFNMVSGKMVVDIEEELIKEGVVDSETLRKHLGSEYKLFVKLLCEDIKNLIKPLLLEM